MLNLYGSALISKCWISLHKKAGIGRHTTKKYGSGRVEIWNELSDKEYHVSIMPST
jgi:hypothetical protein